MYCGVQAGQYLSEMFPITNGLKEGDALSQVLLNFALEYAIRRIQANQEGLKLNGTHQNKVYADDVNIMSGSIYFKYLGRTITNQTSIQQEIKSRMKSENACCHLLQNLSSFSLFSKNIKIKIYGTIILPVVLYGCETWSLTLREEFRLRTFENGVLRKIFGPKRDKVTRGWRRLHMKQLSDLYSSPHIIQIIKSRRMRWAGQAAYMGGEERCIQGFGGET